MGKESERPIRIVPKLTISLDLLIAIASDSNGS